MTVRTYGDFLIDIRFELLVVVRVLLDCASALLLGSRIIGVGSEREFSYAAVHRVSPDRLYYFPDQCAALIPSPIYHLQPHRAK